VGANTCIDRGTLSDTVIGRGTKIDNLAHIAHNVRVGEDCIIVALAFLGGGVVVGDGTWIGPDASVLQSLTVGSNVLVGMGTVVTKDVPDRVVVAGVPARVLRENT
jgi:UDP-3-O-[3-hydroxymyristoyl] glucosamine N-acyltransferase